MSSLVSCLKRWMVSGLRTFPTSISEHRFHGGIARARRQWRGSPSGGQTWSASRGISSRIPAANRAFESSWRGWIGRSSSLAITMSPSRETRFRGPRSFKIWNGDPPFRRPGRARSRVGEGSVVVGVDPVSYSEKRAHPHALVPPGVAFRLLLCHFPGIVDRIPEESFDLILAGHLHAGQICLPTPHRRVTLAHPRAPFVSGLYRTKAGVMHISPGTGTTFVPFRFFARPEVTELVLRRPH